MTLCQFWGFNCPQVSSRLACQRICLFSVSASEIEPTPQLHILFCSPDAMISSRASVFLLRGLSLLPLGWKALLQHLRSIRELVWYFNVWTWRRLREQLFLTLRSASVSLWSKAATCLNCFSQTCCSKAFPSLPKFNSRHLSFGEMRVWPLTYRIHPRKAFSLSQRHVQPRWNNRRG